MIAAWPSELPKPLVSAYSENAGESRRFVHAGQGVPRVRRRASLAARTVGMTLMVPSANLRATFDRFWDEHSKLGALPFLMDDPTRHGLPMSDEVGQIITTETGDPITIVETWLCLFGEGAPAHNSVGKQRWNISFTLMVLP